MQKCLKAKKMLQENPDMSLVDVAKACKVHVATVYKAQKLLREEQQLQAVLPSLVPKTFSDALAALDKFDAQQASLVPEPNSGSVELMETLLTARGSRYGKFKDTAQVAQELKRVLTRHAHAINASFSDSQWEALEMICHKAARIVNGDPNYIDSWIDIAGYAQLIADELKGIDR